MAEEIIITKGFADGTLELSDKGHTKAKKGKEIKWKIKDKSGLGSIKVASIELIEIKNDPDNIMSIPYEDGDKWKAEVDKHAPEGAECKYSIHWKDTTGKPREYDPKISVLPSGLRITTWLFGGLLAAALAFFTLMFFGSNKEKR